MMMTRMAKKSHTGDDDTARPDDFGARGGGRRRELEDGAGEDRKS